uniref:Uncharacterized protein n=1 Tax=Trichuris muris TaxID=70415 RepID=A0A5S6Q7M7_TRIMR
MSALQGEFMPERETQAKSYQLFNFFCPVWFKAKEQQIQVETSRQGTLSVPPVDDLSYLYEQRKRVVLENVSYVQQPRWRHSDRWYL